MLQHNGNFLALRDISDRDKYWSANKQASGFIARYYRESEYFKLADRVSNCANNLSFEIFSNSDGDQRLKIRSANLCHVRLCPVCLRCRTKVNRAKLINTLKQIDTEIPDQEYLLLTLTKRNCDSKELRDNLVEMSKSFQRFVKRKEFKKAFNGYYKALEITRSKSNQTHPHYHVLLGAKKSYFSHNYITQKELSLLWQDALRIDYTPIIDIRKIYNKKKIKTDSFNKLEAVLEIAKYLTKSSDLIGKGNKTDRDYFIDISNQISGIKQNTVSGIFKDYGLESEPEEEEIFNLENDDSDQEIATGKILNFRYFSGKNEYLSFDC